MRELTRDQYVQTLAGVVQGSFDLPEFRSVCAELEPRVQTTNVFWLEISALTWATAIAALPSEIRSSQAILADSISAFAGNTIASAGPPGARSNIANALLARVDEYQSAVLGPSPAWEVGRLFGRHVSIADPFETTVLGALLVPLASFFKDCFAQMNLRS